MQGWRSGESICLPQMWPGFDSQIRRQVWVDFVGFSPGTPVFLCSQKSTLILISALALKDKTLK